VSRAYTQQQCYVQALKLDPTCALAWSNIAVIEGTPKYLQYVRFLEVLSSQSLASDVAAIYPTHICCFSPQVTADAAFMATLLLKHGTKILDGVPAEHRTPVRLRDIESQA